MDTLEAEVVLQLLTAGWRAGRCYQQHLQDFSAPPDPSTALCLAWAVQRSGLSPSGQWLCSGDLVQCPSCLLVVLLHCCVRNALVFLVNIHID